MIANSALELIGNTPMLKLNKLTSQQGPSIYLKLEMYNIAGSVKDRVALAMIEEAEATGLLKPGQTIIEATSGNTGVGLAMVGAVKGYPVIIVMSEKASKERRQLIAAYGGHVVLSNRPGGIVEDIKFVSQLANEKGYFMPSQFYNLANPRAHYQTTAQEIIRDLGRVPDAVVAGVGTGGTLIGIAQALKAVNPNCKIFPLEPSEASLLNGGPIGEHLISGIGASILDGVIDASYFEKVLTVDSNAAIQMVTELARKEGVFLGTSSAAAVVGALEIAPQFDEREAIVVIAPDTGERYLSMNLFDSSCLSEIE